MNRVALSLAFATGLLYASRLEAATVRLDAFAAATYNAADFSPPAVPLVTDADGNVLNATVGQVYEVWIALSVADLGMLPNGTPEKGLATVTFDVDLHRLSENLQLPGWNLSPQYINLRGGLPRGLVPLWVDVCNCGNGGPLREIRAGVDVADFPQADVPPNNPVFDLRRTVGQGLSDRVLVGWVFVDYLGQENSHLNVSIDSFEVHDLSTTYPGVGTAIGDRVRFVPEPAACAMLVVGAVVLRSSHWARETRIA